MKSLRKYLFPYLAMIAALGALEYIWFLHVINGFVSESLSHVMEPQVKYIGVIIFYLFYPIAVYVFALRNSSTFKQALSLGAFFGFSVYLIYEATNYAIIYDWPILFSLLDVAWGTFITGLISAIGFKVKNR